MTNDNDSGEHQDQEQNDLIKRAQNGEHETFVKLLVDHGYRKVIDVVIQELTSQTTLQETREALYRKLEKDVYLALPEFHPGDEDFGDWLHRTTRASLIAEHKRIIRAKKGDKDAFLDLIVEYEDVIHKVVQEYALKLQEYEEKTLFDAILNEAFWAVRGFRLHQNAFELWLHDTATENCCFIYSKEQFKHGNQEAFGEVFSQYYEQLIPKFIQKKFPKMQEQDKEEVLQDVTLRAYEEIPQFRGNLNSFKKWLRNTTRGVCLNMITKHKKAWFKLTYFSFQKLRNEGIPNTGLERLKCLEDQEFTKDDLLHAVESQIGKEQTDTYKKLIVKHADKKYQKRETSLGTDTLPDPSPTPDFRDTFNFVQELIKLLPSKYREVILLQQQGLQYEEIMEGLNIKMGTVKSRLNTARTLLINMRELVEERGITIERIRDRLSEGKTSLTKVLKEFSQDASFN